MTMFFARLGCTFAAVMAILPALLFAGCIAVGPLDRPSGEEALIQDGERSALMDSVNRWWRARSDRDHAVMYELFERSYRDRVDLATFTRESTLRSKLPIVAFKVVEARIDGDSATVRLRVESPSPKSGEQRDFVVEERWIREAGVWHKRYTPPQLPFPESVTSGRPAEQ